MKIKDINSDEEKYILLDAGEIWDLELSLEGKKAIYVKPVENEMQIGAKQYINGLIKMMIAQLENNKDEANILDRGICEKFQHQIEILEKLYKSLEWNIGDE